MNGNKQELAPVVLMTYARPEHTKRTLDALAENKLAAESELYIFCDGPKNEKAVSGNSMVRELIQQEEVKGRFKKVHVRFSEKNRGLANSIISGATEVIEKYGKCIVLEDDMVTSPYFLTYMNDCLKFYQDDQRIWSISGLAFPMKTLKNYPHDVFLSYRASSNGWGTWIDRWETIDWDVKDYEELKRSFSKRRKFNRGGNDLFRMLRHQMRGERDSWAIRFCYAQSKQNCFCVYPKHSLISNIGYDGSGTHTPVDNQKNARPLEISDVQCINIEHIEPCKNILREFKKEYKVKFGEGVKWVLCKIKTKLKKRG